MPPKLPQYWWRWLRTSTAPLREFSRIQIIVAGAKYNCTSCKIRSATGANVIIKILPNNHAKVLKEKAQFSIRYFACNIKAGNSNLASQVMDKVSYTKMR